jgi:hypothetical protein
MCAGFVSCGIVVLLCDLALKHGPYYTTEGLVRLFQCMAVQCALGLVAAVLLVRSNWQKLALAATAGAHKAGGVGVSNYSQKGEVIELKLVPGWGERVGSRGVLGGSSKGHHQHYGSSSIQHGESYSHGSTAVADNGEHDGVVVDVEAAAMKRHGVAGAAAGSSTSPWGNSSSSHTSSSSSSALVEQHRYGKGGRKGKRLGLVTRGLQQIWHGVTGAHEQVKVLLPLLRAIAMPAVALLLSVGSSMLAFPFFTYVPVNGALGAHVHQVRAGWWFRDMTFSLGWKYTNYRVHNLSTFPLVWKCPNVVIRMILWGCACRDGMRRSYSTPYWLFRETQNCLPY